MEDNKMGFGKKPSYIGKMSIEEVRQRRATVEKSMLTTSRKELAIMAIPVVIMIIGFGYFYGRQLSEGLIRTNLSSKVFWGVYMSNFVFWIGVSHVGMLISAILRSFQVEWRTPITRVAEEITIVSLFMGIASVLIDMGRIDRIFNMIKYGRLDSPLIWDVISIMFYLVGSFIFFYAPIIPDFAYYRDNLDPVKYKWRVRLYRLLAINWRASDEQKNILEEGILSKFKWYIIPVALSVHTVVSWIMAMTWRPGWASTVFGVYFIGGAIFSGTAALVSSLVIFSKAFKLEDIITPYHIKQVMKILIVTNLAYGYLTLNELLSGGYRSVTHEAHLLEMLFYGEYAFTFWFIILGTMLFPFIMGFRVLKYDEKTEGGKILGWALFLSLLVNVGAWLKRFIIIVPTLQVPTRGEEIVIYLPSATEIWISLAQLSFFIFFYWLLNKIVPIIPLWETEHEFKHFGFVDEPTPQDIHEASMK